MNCRHCGTKLFRTFIDLGSAPPSNAYLTNQAVSESEKWYPLKVLVCDRCWLVQTEDFVAAAELFSEEYAYFSSYSRLWVDHAKAYADLITTRLQLTNKSLVVEIAANDGYLLQNFKKNGIPCYGVEPTARTAATAIKKGIPIIQDFFGVALARKLQTDKQRANLIVANNVLAHVPDINDFVSGIPVLLAENGTATFEFPHLLKLVENNQFDTIYHEHFSYLSLTTVNIIFNAHGLTIYDVEEIPTHGGSLRLYAQRRGSGIQPVNKRLNSILNDEKNAGITTISFYEGFQQKAEQIKVDFLEFLGNAKRSHKTVAAYGAAAKGNTLLNFAGVGTNLISYVVDNNPEKQGKYLPGSRIPIVKESHLQNNRPDYLVILPWNLKSEISERISSMTEQGMKIVTAIPELSVS